MQGCNSRFADAAWKVYSLELLQAEHERFRGLESEQARKAFVIARVPIAEKNKSKLYAANQIVCQAFFKAVFPISNNTIYAAKGTPGARASSNVRCVR